MTLRTIQRTAIGGGLSLTRLPLDTVLRFAGNGGSAAVVRLAVDRADAAARTLLGALLGDEELQDDGARLSAAADERARAISLRRQADRQTERAEQRVEEREHEAGERRMQAKAKAQQRRDQARQRRNSRKSSAAKTANRRRQAAKQDAARTEARIDERAKRDRVEQLEATTDALRERDAALTAADEGERLGDAAATAKARRKNGG